MGFNPGEDLARGPLGSYEVAKRIQCTIGLSASDRFWGGPPRLRAYLGVEINDTGHSCSGLGSSDCARGGNLGGDEGRKTGDNSSGVHL